MMKHFSIALCLAGMLAACHHEPPQPVSGKAVAAVTTLPAPAKHAGDTAFISGSCVVLYSMSEKKIAVVKKEYKDEEEFETAMDDSYYYLANARDTLEKRHVRTLDTTGEKLYFKTTDGNTFILDFHGRNHVVDAYIFDGLHQPAPADLTDVMTDYNQVIKGR